MNGWAGLRNGTALLFYVFVFSFSCHLRADDDVNDSGKKPPHELRDELIKKARDPGISKNAYVQIIKQAQGIVPHRPYAAQIGKNGQILIDWLDGLDPLFEAGRLNHPLRTWRFDRPHPALVALAEQLTQGAATLINYMNYDGPNWEFVKNFYKWSEEETRVFVADGQRFFVAEDLVRIQDPNERRSRMKVWHERLAKGESLLRDIIPLVGFKSSDPKIPIVAPLGVDFLVNTRTEILHLEALGRSDSVVVGAMLNPNESVVVTDVDFLVSHCLAESAIRIALKRLFDVANDPDRKDSPSVKLIGWALELDRKIDYLEKMGTDVDDGLRAQAGDIIIAALRKHLEGGYSIGEESIEPIFQRLKKSRQLETLAMTLGNVFEARFLSDDQMEFVYKLAVRLSEHIRDSDQLFQEFLQRTLAQKQRKLLGWEGTYEIAIGREKNPGILTIAFTGGPGRFVVGMTRNNGVRIPYNFSKVTMHGDSASFTASRPELNSTLSFRIKPMTKMVHGQEVPQRDRATGKPINVIVDGHLSKDSQPRHEAISGTQVYFIPNFPLKDQGIPWKDLHATFTGKNGWGESVAMTFEEQKEDLLMAIFYPHGLQSSIPSFTLDTAFIDRPKRLGIFTTPEQVNSGNQRVIQVRGIFLTDENTFLGFQLKGGAGFTYLVMKRNWNLEESDEIKKHISDFLSIVRDHR